LNIAVLFLLENRKLFAIAAICCNVNTEEMDGLIGLIDFEGIGVAMHVLSFDVKWKLIGHWSKASMTVFIEQPNEWGPTAFLSIEGTSTSM